LFFKDVNQDGEDGENILAESPSELSTASLAGCSVPLESSPSSVNKLSCRPVLVLEDCMSPGTSPPPHPLPPPSLTEVGEKRKTRQGGTRQQARLGKSLNGDVVAKDSATTLENENILAADEASNSDDVPVSYFVLQSDDKLSKVDVDNVGPSTQKMCTSTEELHSNIIVNPIIQEDSTESADLMQTFEADTESVGSSKQIRRVRAKAKKSPAFKKRKVVNKTSEIKDDNIDVVNVEDKQVEDDEKEEDDNTKDAGEWMLTSDPAPDGRMVFRCQRKSLSRTSLDSVRPEMAASTSEDTVALESNFSVAPTVAGVENAEIVSMDPELAEADYLYTAQDQSDAVEDFALTSTYSSSQSESVPSESISLTDLSGKKRGRPPKNKPVHGAGECVDAVIPKRRGARVKKGNKLLELYATGAAASAGKRNKKGANADFSDVAMSVAIDQAENELEDTELGLISVNQLDTTNIEVDLANPIGLDEIAQSSKRHLVTAPIIDEIPPLLPPLELKGTEDQVICELPLRLSSEKELKDIRLNSSSLETSHSSIATNLAGTDAAKDMLPPKMQLDSAVSNNEQLKSLDNAQQLSISTKTNIGSLIIPSNITKSFRGIKKAILESQNSNLENWDVTNKFSEPTVVAEAKGNFCEIDQISQSSAVVIQSPSIVTLDFVGRNSAKLTSLSGVGITDISSATVDELSTLGKTKTVSSASKGSKEALEVGICTQSVDLSGVTMKRQKSPISVIGIPDQAAVAVVNESPSIELVNPILDKTASNSVSLPGGSVLTTRSGTTLVNPIGSASDTNHKVNSGEIPLKKRWFNGSRSRFGSVSANIYIGSHISSSGILLWVNFYIHFYLCQYLIFLTRVRSFPEIEN